MLKREHVERYLKADFGTGALTWVFHRQRPDLIGRREGHLNQGYWRLAFDGTEYYAAQIVWLLFYGEWPKDTIDHRNLDKADDSITNLRLATRGQNNANSKLSCRNTSGYKGVSWSSATGKWRGDITINGEKKVLGYFEEALDAHNAWLAAACEAFGSEFVRAE